MRKITHKIFTVCVFVLLLMNSCVIGEVIDKNEYASHQLAFDYTESVLYEMLYSLDLSARVSAYAYAPSDSVRKVLKKAYFSSDVLSQTSNGWSVENDAGKWNFESNNQPLQEQGAVWKISLERGADKLINLGDFTITATTDNHWKLQVQNIESAITDRLKDEQNSDSYFLFKSSGSYSVTASSPDSIQPFYYDYTINEGNGEFIPTKQEVGHYNAKVNYSVKSPLVLKFNASKYLFSEGKLLFNVIYAENLESESFEAKISTTPTNWEVTYK